MIDKPHIYRRKIISTGKYYIGKHNGNNPNYYKGSGVDYLKDFNNFVQDIKIDLEEEILEIVDNIEQLDIREEYWLKKYDVSNNPQYYNKTNKSRGWSQVTLPQREKISKSKKGKKMSLESSLKKSKSMLGIPKHTEESKSLIGQKNSKPNPKISKALKGKPKSKKHSQNISKGKKGKLYPKLCKIIIQYDLNDKLIKEWNNYRELIINNPNFNIHNIYRCCNGGQKTSYGYKWKYKN